MSDQKTVLIIEDEPDFLRVYHDLLVSKGYVVLTATDGQEGLDLIQSKHPDLLLLDLVLPTLSGFQILEKIKANTETSSIPVIIFSILGDGDDIQKGLTAGATDYAVKGFYSPSEVLRKIEATLNRTGEASVIESYQLGILPAQHDGPRLQQNFQYAQSFTCKACQEPLLLELIPDYTRTQDHWFFSHFICPKCHTIN